MFIIYKPVEFRENIINKIKEVVQLHNSSFLPPPPPPPSPGRTTHPGQIK